MSASGEPFFVFNSDVTCSYPLEDMLSFHRAHGKEGTILVSCTGMWLRVDLC